MRKICGQLAILVACGMAAFLTGCGSGGSGDQTDNSNNSNSKPPPTPSGTAPASIGDNTIHGTFQSPHDPAQTLHWHITTNGTTSGSYTYEEENLPTNSGTYAWTKTGDNTAVLTTSNNGTLEFTYTGSRSGNYTYGRTGYEEQGTFTTDN